MHEIIEQTFWNWSTALIALVVPVIVLRITFEFISDLIFQRG